MDHSHVMTDEYFYLTVFFGALFAAIIMGPFLLCIDVIFRSLSERSARLPMPILMPPADQYMTRVIRSSAYPGAVRGISISVNGQFVGKVQNRSFEDFTVAPGELSIYARQDWLKSQPLQITLNEEKRTAILELDTPYTSVLFAFYFCFIRGNRFFRLREQHA